VSKRRASIIPFLLRSIPTPASYTSATRPARSSNEVAGLGLRHGHQGAAVVEAAELAAGADPEGVVCRAVSIIFFFPIICWLFFGGEFACVLLTHVHLILNRRLPSTTRAAAVQNVAQARVLAGGLGALAGGHGAAAGNVLASSLPQIL
jgi:hypothetical protein